MECAALDRWPKEIGMDWQHWTTAPRDGTRVLLWGPQLGSVVVGFVPPRPATPGVVEAGRDDAELGFDVVDWHPMPADGEAWPAPPTTR